MTNFPVPFMTGFVPPPPSATDVEDQLNRPQLMPLVGEVHERFGEDVENGIKREREMIMGDYMLGLNGPLSPQYTVGHLPPPPPMVGKTNTVYSDKTSIDPYMAAEIASIVHTFSTAQLLYVCAALKNFLKRDPLVARRFLSQNPQLTYALLHSQFILGAMEESVLPLNKVDEVIARINRAEREKDLEEASDSEDTKPSAIFAQVPKVPTHQEFPQEGYVIEPMQGMDPYQMQFVQKQTQLQIQPQGLVHAPVQQPQVPQPVLLTIDDLIRQGIKPAPAKLVDGVLKNAEILTNIQRSTMAEMVGWPEEQKQQVLSIKVALHLKGISVNL